MLDKNDIKNLIVTHSRRLQKLKQQQASFGLDTPPHILIEIEDLERKIDELQIELKQLENVGEPHLQTDTTLSTRGLLPSKETPVINFESLVRDQVLGISGYTILQILAKSSSIVFLAHDERWNRRVAIKVVNLDNLSNEARNQFFSDAHQVAKLHHPGIAKLYDIREREHFGYIIMEYIDGRTLGEIIQTEGFAGQLSFQRTVELITQIARALEYAHIQDVVHKKINPYTILIDFKGNPFLVGFHLGPLPGPWNFTPPVYLSPEVIARNSIDGRSDIYSLGAILYVGKE